jgi:hypothetical protein
MARQVKAERAAALASDTVQARHKPGNRFTEDDIRASSPVSATCAMSSATPSLAGALLEFLLSTACSSPHAVAWKSAWTTGRVLASAPMTEARSCRSMLMPVPPESSSGGVQQW